MNDEQQQYLNDLDRRLWSATDRLRGSVNPSEYMRVVLGLVFLKYVSDAFAERRAELEAAFRDPADDYHLGEDADDLIAQELEARDYYTEKNVFWVPALARWDFLRASARVDAGAALEVRNGTTVEYEFRGIGRLLDDLLSTVPLRHASLGAKNTLGHVYEYFLGEFSIYGREANPTTWRLASMNMAIRGLDFDFGRESANTFAEPQHRDLRADFVMANPPFNMRDWKEGVRDDDPRWRYGVPPTSNANFAWLQHMLHHLAPHGSMALLLANGSMSSTTNNEGEIRQAIVDADLVECMVALPGQLFTNTQIPACVWFLARSKAGRDRVRTRERQFLFIDARNLGYMRDRVLRDFAEADIRRVADTFHAWRRGEGYEDQLGFCRSATVEDVRKNGYVLTPGRYVGAAAREEDAEPFEEKMARLTATLREQFAEGARLEGEIRRNFARLGYEI